LKQLQNKIFILNKFIFDELYSAKSYILSLNKAIFIDPYIICRYSQKYKSSCSKGISDISQFTASQPANLPNDSTQKSSFPCTAAFSPQQHSQPQPAQTNRPLLVKLHPQPTSLYMSVCLTAPP
jgi:hypothetical protein